jgi:hypothetical protein
VEYLVVRDHEVVGGNNNMEMRMLFTEVPLIEILPDGLTLLSLPPVG